MKLAGVAIDRRNVCDRSFKLSKFLCLSLYRVETTCIVYNVYV